MKFHFAILAFALMVNSCSLSFDTAKKSDKEKDDKVVNQVSSKDFKAQFDMKSESTLLMADAHSDAAVKAVIHLQNAGDDVRISFSDAADACIFEVREEEPFDKSTFSLIVYQSYYAYTFQKPNCERKITIERVSDGLTLSKDLQFAFADLAPADDGLEEPTDDWGNDGFDPNAGGFDPDNTATDGGDSPSTPTTGGTMKMCIGVATACSMRFSMGSCWSGGCYWSSATNSCSGYVTPCHVNYTQSSCNAASGCMWQ